MTDTHHIPHRSALALCADVLARLGVSGEEARVCAETMVEASLRGVDSHGISLLGTFAERIRSGQMRPGRRPLVRREAASTALVDGQHGLGPPLARWAVALAQDKARETGLGAVALRDANYVGALATYVEAPARAGLLALAAANSTPRVAPLGGRQALHGTNPIAWAAPAAAGAPLVFDAATGHSAAKVTQAAEEGRQLPPGIGLAADGRPTTDPAAAAAGILLPVGGAMGYGFGLLVDLLAGGLSGGPCGRQVPPVSELGAPYGCGFFVLVVDPAPFGGGLAAAAQGLAEDARATAPAEGVDRVRAPGDRARKVREQRLAAGIPISAGRWQALRRRLQACGVDPGPAVAGD